MALLISMGLVPARTLLCSLPCNTDGEFGWPCILLGHLEIPMGVLPLLTLRRIMEVVPEHVIHHL